MTLRRLEGEPAGILVAGPHRRVCVFAGVRAHGDTGFLSITAMNIFQCIKKLEEIRKGDDARMLVNRTRGAFEVLVQLSCNLVAVGARKHRCC